MVRTAAQVREAFLAYFESRGHRRVPELARWSRSTTRACSSPTPAWCSSRTSSPGGESRPYKRATSSQKCVRAGGKHNDLDNVGFTARHHTFFEMLGNFSFGDYFKEDAVAFAWEFVTRDLAIAPDRLAATVFNGEKGIPWDEEAARLWKRVGVPESRIHRLGYKDNFWAMGDTGPCGPCSELHYYQGDDIPCAEEAAGRTCLGVACECDRWLEIWNLVFMQFERKEKDSPLEPLPAPVHRHRRRPGAHHRGGRRASEATTTPTSSSRCWPGRASCPARPTAVTRRTTSRCGSSPTTPGRRRSSSPTACSPPTRGAATCSGASCGGPSATARGWAWTSPSSTRW